VPLELAQEQKQPRPARQCSWPPHRSCAERVQGRRQRGGGGGGGWGGGGGGGCRISASAPVCYKPAHEALGMTYQHMKTSYWMMTALAIAGFFYLLCERLHLGKERQLERLRARSRRVRGAPAASLCQRVLPQERRAPEPSGRGRERRAPPVHRLGLARASRA
jgi:hypothetical protein